MGHESDSRAGYESVKDTSRRIWQIYDFTVIDLETRDALGYYPRKYKKGNRFF